MKLPKVKNKIMLFTTIIYLFLLIKTIIFKDNLIYQNNLNLIPLTFISNFNINHLNYWLINIFGNIIIFIPLPIILKYYFRFLKNGHIILIGLTTSLSFELIQLASHWGIFDIDDIILNLIGVAIGLLLNYIIQKFNKAHLITNIFLSSLTTISFISVYVYYPKLISL